MSFELSNEQRVFFGLDPVKAEWEKVILKGDTYRPDSVLYFEGNTIKRHIVSTAEKYEENHYNELTSHRNVLLPVKSRGKERKLTASVLEARQPQGVYCHLNAYGRIRIGNYRTQTTFYDSLWERDDLKEAGAIGKHVERFIATSSSNCLFKIEEFKNSKRKNVKFKRGDFFAFKISRSEYGFGRVLLDIHDLKKKNLISEEHGLSLIMGRPVLIKLYAYTSEEKDCIELLTNTPSLPSDYIMDNKLFYGEYEVIGNRPLVENDLEFPMSYGRHIDGRRNSVFFQWGLIHIELPFSKFNKYLSARNPFVPESSPSSIVTNPYGYYSVGFSPNFDAQDIKAAVLNNGVFDYRKVNFKSEFDLRNPKNTLIQKDIMEEFGLDGTRGYNENCRHTQTITTTQLLEL